MIVELLPYSKNLVYTGLFTNMLCYYYSQEHEYVMLLWASVCCPLICIIAVDELQIMN